MADWTAQPHGAIGQVITLFEVVSTAVGYSLEGAINSSTTALSVRLGESLATWTAPLANDVFQVDDEDMLVVSASAWGSGRGYNLTVTRAWGGTDAASHSANATCRHWRDFGNLLPNAATGRHRILSLPTIKHSAEKSLNTITSSISSMLVANGDQQWNDPTWFGGWSGRLVRFYWATPEEDRANYSGLLPGHYITALGTFMIDDVVVKDDKAEIKLVSLEVPLKESRTAEAVRDRGWYQTKAAKWLLERLLGVHYHGARESPPKYWTADVPANLELETRGSRSVFSNYGRPPEWDGTKWIENAEICRAMCLDTDKEHLIFGVGDTLWRRNLTTLIDTQIGIPSGATGWIIARLWRSERSGLVASGIAMRQSVQDSSGGIFTLCVQIIPFKINTDWSITTYTIARAFPGAHVITAIPWNWGNPADIYHTPDEAIVVPFRQRVICSAECAYPSNYYSSTGPTAQDYAADHIYHLTATGMSAWYSNSSLYEKLLDTLNGWLRPGYRFVFVPADDPPSGPIRNSMGQRGCFAYVSSFGTAGAIYWMQPTAGLVPPIYYRVARLDLGTGTVKECTDNSIAYGTQPHPYDQKYIDVPTAMTAIWTGSEAHVFVATHKTNSNTEDEPPYGATFVHSDNRIRRYRDTAVGSNITYDTAIFDNDTYPDVQGWRYYTILEMAPGPGNYIHMCGLVRGPTTMYALAPRYRTARILASASAGSNPALTNGPYGSYFLSSQLCGMVYDDTVTNQDYRLWAVNGEGLLVRWSETGSAWVAADGINGLVLEEPYTTGPLVPKIQNTTPPTVEIYGVSAPQPSWFCNRTDDAAVTWTHPEGKYYLWKVSRMIADRFPLADFSDWSIWDAIQKIAGAMRRVAWFDRRGKFRFDALPEVGGTGADHGISAVDSRWDYLYLPWIERPSLSHGQQEIYNSATAIPWDTVLGKPGDARLALSPSSELLAENPTTGKSYPPTIEVSVKSIYPARVLLRCVTGGRLLATGDTRRPIFRAETDAPRTSLMLTQQASGTEWIYVDHIPIDQHGALGFAVGATTGDFVTIGDTDYWDASGRRIVDYDLTLSRLKVSPAINSTNDPEVSGIYPAGTPVNIISASEGVTLGATALSYAFASGVPVDVGQGITVKLTSGAPTLDLEPWFRTGDTLVIETNGLELQKAERSIQSVVAMASIKAGFGKREAKLEENRLLTKATALELARYTVDSYKYPHFEIAGGVMRFVPWLDPLTLLHLRDPFLFPNSANAGMASKSERIYVRSVTHDMRKLRTTIDCRGTRNLT